MSQAELLDGEFMLLSAVHSSFLFIGCASSRPNVSYVNRTPNRGVIFACFDITLYSRRVCFCKLLARRKLLCRSQ